MKPVSLCRPAGAREERGDLVVVADAHLGENDPDLPAFCAFLAARGDDAAAVVLLGDIFSLWLGSEKFTLPHHRMVLEACERLRKRGVSVVFIEGNREFDTRRWCGRAFDDVGDSMIAAPWGERSWYLSHGDRLDRSDRQGRLFRWLTRSKPFVFCYRRLPRETGLRLGGKIERALRHRNLSRKTSIPRERFSTYADWLATRGYDGGVIGHIHVEMKLELKIGAGGSRPLFVLPDWRSGHRYLRISPEGQASFETFGPPRPVFPAVIDSRETEAGVLLVLDRPVDLVPGAAVAISAGHGPEVRRGLVRAAAAESDEQNGGQLRVELEQGPPVQVGDRLLYSIDVGNRGRRRA